MNKMIIAAVSLLAFGSIAGCGSSGSTSNVTAVTGKVADGYLVGATVFLDKNGNYQLDAGEPSATTDANGAYTLKLDPADVGNYPIVVMATQGVTIDTDTNLPIQHSFVLSMPKDSVSGTVSNFISPMSTQVRELMGTGKYTLAQAMDQLRAQLGLPAGANVMADFLTNPGDATSQTMHTASRNMATLMGSQMSQVLTTNGSTTTVDVNRYRGMMGTIFSNISSVRSSNPNATSVMTNLMGAMTSNLPNIKPGQPYRNMSTAFRNGMM